MNNTIFNIISGKDRKLYKFIIRAIERKDYISLFAYDDRENFGFSNPKYAKKILKRMEEEIFNSIDLLIKMNVVGYHRTDYFNEIAVKSNPKIIETFVENNILTSQILSMALDNGYSPSENYINQHINLFASTDIIKKLIDKGYRPTNDMIEHSPLINIFDDEELFLKALSWGYIPSIKFLQNSKVFKNPNLTEKILDIIEINSDVVNDKIFYGNALAQHYIIKNYPELLESVENYKPSYNQFWIEAFKQGYIPKNISDEKSYSPINSDFLLFSKVIKQKPELIVYCTIYEDDKKEKLDELALCMGFVPSISDVQAHKYVRKSYKLMQAIIQRRPEAIKYVELIPEQGFHPGSQDEKVFYLFTELCTLAINNGYIPTEEDIKNHPVLTNNFEIMKVLIQENPNAINYITEYTPQKEELLKIAIENGFKGPINIKKIGNNNLLFRDPDDLNATETAIIFRLNQGLRLDSTIKYGNNYSINLYNVLISNGYQIDEIINLFTNNFEVIKQIITEHPEYITSISRSFSRKEIDELGILAIKNGYEPKFEDEIFGFGIETAKFMLLKYPNYLPKVSLFDRVGIIGAQPCSAYDELCKIATDAGFIPDIEKMGDGFGNVTTTIYNYSYDIMKKVIPINPKLIESCRVSDKGKYDELCRLALSHGYKVTDEYVLLHSGIQMCSNYDIMAQYIPTNPKFLTKITVTDADEIMKLIDIAINAGLDINKLSQKQLLKLFLEIDEQNWNKYLTDDTIKALQKVKNLYVNNDEIAKTANTAFLQDEIASHFTPIQIEILSCYPILQNKILSLSSDSYKANIIYELVAKYKENLEWIPILEKVLTNIESAEYISLLESTRDKELSPVEKDLLITLLITDNHLDISSYEELKKFNIIKKEYISNLIERNTLGSLKTAYFEKVFGIDLATAINLVTLYGKSLEFDSIKFLDEDSRKDFIILENMKKIIDLNNIEVLKYYIENVNFEFAITPDLMLTYESRLKKLFTQEFNKSFTKPSAEDKITSDMEEEQELDIYLAAGHDGKKKCRLMITSIGAYTTMAEPDDYYASWNVDKIASHGCCCSYVGEKNLGTAEVKYCCLGFTDYDFGSLQLSAPYDLCSFSSEDSYKILAEYASLFLLPDDILSCTRHTHNETVWERRNISGDIAFKKQPAYIVYFVDNFEERLTDPEAIKQWESVKKAAKNFAIEINGIKRPLPIMVVEREKIAKAQIEIIQDTLQQFKTSFDPSLIRKIISDYESNYAGNREYHLNISEKYFPKHEKLSDSVVGEIIKTIEKIYKIKPNLAKECIYELEKTIKQEKEKYNNTQHGVKQAVPSFNIEEALMEVNRIKSLFSMEIDSTLMVVSKSEENERQYESSDVSTMDQTMIEAQLSPIGIIKVLESTGLDTNFVMLENEIKQEHVNSKLKVHGPRHIKNVLLYSTLIGQSVVEDKHSLELLMIAAKYHDIGRKTDAYESHAGPSAEIALEKLRDKYSPHDLAIIKTIIEFHEVSRTDRNIDETFANIAKNNDIDDSQLEQIRCLAEVLKDADALDRTRFINNARLNPELLHFDMSKRLIKLAASVQETYAIIDLKEFHCDEAIDILLQTYTPQEVLRTIRHSTRGSLNLEDIQNFINSWASSLLANSNYETDKEGVSHEK